MAISVIGAEVKLYPPGECSPKPFDAKPPARSEARPAARDQVEYARPADRPEQLCGGIGTEFGRGEPAAGPEPNRDRRIQMTTRDVSDRMSHRQHGQTECEGDTHESDSGFGEGRGQDRTPVPAEYEPEAVDEFCGELSSHFRIASVATTRMPEMEKKTPGRACSSTNTRLATPDSISPVIDCLELVEDIPLRSHRSERTIPGPLHDEQNASVRPPVRVSDRVTRVLYATQIDHVICLSSPHVEPFCAACHCGFMHKM